jgi:hypothetical protein
MELVTMPLPFIRSLRDGEHLVEEAASLLELSQRIEVHQLVSWRWGSIPISRLRNDVLHAPKATNPRAIAATATNTPVTFNALTNDPYQPLTSHLRTDSGSGVPVRSMERTPPVHCKFGDHDAGRFVPVGNSPGLIRPFQNEIILTKRNVILAENTPITQRSCGIANCSFESRARWCEVV